MPKVDHAVAMLTIRREAHAYSRNPDAPWDEHDWEEIVLPCSTYIRILPTPILWHPDGHHGIRCRSCGVVHDATLAGDLFQQYQHDGPGPGYTADGDPVRDWGARDD